MYENMLGIAVILKDNIDFGKLMVNVNDNNRQFAPIDLSDSPYCFPCKVIVYVDEEIQKDGHTELWMKVLVLK